MNSLLLNTPNEAAYRLLLALSVWPAERYSSRWISAVDFIAEYGAEFEIADTNLHGDNGMKFTEYVVRIETVDQALRMMVLNKWLTVSVGDAGYLYRIAPVGIKLAENFQTSYACMYRNIANVSYAKY